MVNFHLSQVNIARLKAGFDSELLNGLTLRIHEINELAEKSQGFVWRYQSPNDGKDDLLPLHDYFVPYESQLLFYNMSLWETPNALKYFLYQSKHVELLQRKDEWMIPFDKQSIALWWVKIGHFPTVAESAERLKHLAENGNSSFAFDFQKIYPPLQQ